MNVIYMLLSILETKFALKIDLAWLYGEIINHETGTLYLSCLYPNNPS